jgi:hypothetical protein
MTATQDLALQGLALMDLAALKDRLPRFVDSRRWRELSIRRAAAARLCFDVDKGLFAGGQAEADPLVVGDPMLRG